MSLENKVVLITGASGAPGRQLIDSFSGAGASIAFCGRQTGELFALEQQFRDQQRSVTAFPCDVRHEEDVVRMVHRVVQRFKRIDVLVNAASIVGPKVPVMDYPTDPWRDVIATNLTGSYLVCREVLPWMTRQKSGSIINVTSGVAASAKPGWGAFMASKCAIEGMTRMLAEEVREQGVRVNVVDFGTPRVDRRGAETIQDCAAPFLWLAADRSSETTGARISAAEFKQKHLN